MKKIALILPILLIGAGAMLLFERPAYGYTDPGTGLLAIQAIGSALVATGWYLRRKIYGFINWRNKANQEPAPDSSEKSDAGSSL